MIEEAPAGEAAPPQKSGAAQEKPGPQMVKEEPRPVSTATAQQAPAETAGKRLATPLAKRIADEHGVDLSRVQPSKPDGRIRQRDGEESEHLAASDVDKLSEILSHRGPPLELPAELERLD